ncbi:transcriptional regulator [Paraburkholderia diazotrophica]|uniref:DNA-binding transcriptional regulator YdaS, prophage-encoded, Cro superfamily n=1 Tax=Paraburkholderia diazotrophica TaxID=667676 RepID=A0A1H6QDZ6_9BURK|nr:Cro/CI family transcriptional regulator [Paraburkholderia diazotrophica]SEI41923.1 DNA-binding transcriptional regulator YdaS, prophage-encoded, Cro superfamily [Paraburkholderia diazotrophica]
MNKHPVAIAAAEVGGFKALAEKLGVTKGAVHQWMSPGRKVPIEHCTPIEQATNGIVTRQMLRPDDWQSIWPELVEPAKQDASDDVQPPVGGVKKGSKLARASAVQ